MLQPLLFVAPALLPGISSSPPAGVQGPDLTRYVLVCALLLVAIIAVAWVFRRMVGGALRAKAAGRSLQVIDLLPLGGKQKLCVVRCYDRTFALGLGDREVCLISELDGVTAPHAAGTERAAFAQTLDAASRADGAHPAEPQSTRDKAVRRVQQLLRGGGLLG